MWIVQPVDAEQKYRQSKPRLSYSNTLKQVTKYQRHKPQPDKPKRDKSETRDGGNMRISCIKN